jgi:hypothetical protein
LRPDRASFVAGHFALLSVFHFICHPERSGWFAKRSSHEVEGPPRRQHRPGHRREFSRAGRSRAENSLTQYGGSQLHRDPSTPQKHPLRGRSRCAQDDSQESRLGQECPARTSTA